VAAHVVVVAVTFMIGSGDLAWRLTEPGSRAAAPVGAAVLSLAAATAACTGGFLGGKLVFGHGIGVTALLPAAPPAAAQAPGADTDLPGTTAGADHVGGAQDSRDAGTAPAAVIGGRRRRPR
jgi:hypothetical protein